MSFEELNKIVAEINTEYSISTRQLFEMAKDDQYIPLTLFGNKKLGLMEILVKYMHENLDMSFVEISKKINRDQRTIWCTYHKASNKMSEHLPELEGYLVPLNIFKERKGPMKIIVHYLKDKLQLNNSQISKLLDRNTRLIWCADR